MTRRGGGGGGGGGEGQPKGEKKAQVGGITKRGKRSHRIGEKESAHAMTEQSGTPARCHRTGCPPSRTIDLYVCRGRREEGREKKNRESVKRKKNGDK